MDAELKNSIEQTATRHANEAARLLDELATHATRLAEQVRRSPRSGYTADGLNAEVAAIMARLAKADALVTLTER
ncbi:hypothetical protein ArV1_089 [Arthrobacter phage vB_ArtM-ArV1]|uniref:Uncharacterized protein n=1 Tax=Arthrobacter phage vB_ArtM-ArV1 TaxID=1566993 RepID=A0A0A7HBX9_9CAUD|nr:hypothetical protein ArV1_089 [Arthrobacter phage vB_ArtM-ArV1]AIZ01776.1 hypothetical protein ArV1_089 [Arthrobacter phage vB_ArtM-ArV1]